MKSVIITIIIAMFVLPLLSQADVAVPGPSYKPMVFACNLGTKGMDILIGNAQETVFYTSDMIENDTTELVPVDETGSYILYYKFAGDEDWTAMKGKVSGENYQVTLKNGYVLGLVIGSDNSVMDYEINYNKTDSPKIIFANLSTEDLAVLEAGSEFEAHDGSWCDDLAAMTPSNAGDIAAGEYNLYWQTYDQYLDDEYYFYPDDSGENPSPHTIEAGNWYEMMIADVDGKSLCTMFTITPKYSYLRE
jgi:hypothetical protein